MLACPLGAAIQISSENVTDAMPYEDWKMIQKKFEDVTFADIEQLIENEIRESRTLDYKRDLPNDNTEDKREFLADVVSLANAAGGDLVFGIADRKDQNGKNTGIPEFYGLPGDLNADQVAQRLVNLLRDGIHPKVPLVQIKFMDGPKDMKVGLLRVAKSWAGPHMVAFKTAPAFYSRTSVGRQPLDIHEIRNAFVGAEQLSQRIQDFRTERLGKILADELPCRMRSEQRIVLHLVPYQSLARGTLMNLVPIYNNQTPLMPTHTDVFSHRYNLDGLLAYSEWADKTTAAYLQVYRDGRIETVESEFLAFRGDPNDFKIHFIYFEERLIKSIESYLAVYRTNEIGAPVALMLSLLNVKGAFIRSHEIGLYGPNAISDQHLILPDVLIEDFDQPVDQILRPCFDAIWNACGFERCLSYDENGRWQDISRRNS